MSYMDKNSIQTNSWIKIKMKDILEFIKDIPKIINSSDGLESMMGLIALCVVTPIILLIGLVVYKLVEYFLF